MGKEFEPPSYEKYIKATSFARFRYKYGLIVQIIGIILFLFLIFYMVTYARELAQNPLSYATEKTNTECTCKELDSGRMFYVNSTHVILKDEYSGGLILE